MPFSKRLSLAASAALLVLSVGAASAQETTIKIGTEGAYPPFNNLTASGELEGFDIDLTKALCEEMKAKCEFVTQDWDGIIPALQAKRFDAIVASMSITEERKQQVDFTNPYYSNSLVFVAPKDSKFAATETDGKTIGVQQGTISAEFAEKTYADADVKAYPTQVEAWADLESGVQGRPRQLRRQDRHRHPQGRHRACRQVQQGAGSHPGQRQVQGSQR
jgi:polar amino acid transport system substrate-binding protein